MSNGARRLHSAYEQHYVVAGWPAAKMQKWKILPAYRQSVGERVSLQAYVLSV